MRTGAANQPSNRKSLSGGVYAELLENEGRFGQARHYHEQAVQRAHETSNLDREAIAHNNLADALFFLGDYASARTHADEAARLRQQLGLDIWHIHLTISWIAHRLDQHAEALLYAQLCVDAVRASGKRVQINEGMLALGDALAGLERWPEAEAVYREVLAFSQKLVIPTVMATALAGLAHIALAQEQHTVALARANEALVLLHVARPSVILEPLRSGWACYQALAANNDPRAESILRDAYAILIQQADWIEDLALRRSFLENVVIHREIAQAFTALPQDTSKSPAYALQDHA